MGWNNRVKIEARNAARRYRELLDRLGRTHVSVTVHGSHILIGFTSYTAPQVEEMARQLEARL